MRWCVVGVLTVTAVFAADVPACRASGNAPWCMNIQSRTGGQRCAYQTFEQCLEDARAGNIGYCAANPFYHAPERAKARHRRYTTH